MTHLKFYIIFYAQLQTVSFIVEIQKQVPFLKKTVTNVEDIEHYLLNKNYF